MTIRKNIHNMSQGPPNPGFTKEKVQKRDFLKKPFRKNIHNMPQGLLNPGFMQKKSTKRGFSKKALAKIEKLFLF